MKPESESSNEKTVWKCTQCAKEFQYESDMRRHELSHVPQFECKLCWKKFSYLSALRRHEATHERTGSVQCSKCGRNFRDEFLLKRHERYSHKGTYKCDKCTASFNSDAALSTHTKTHNPESERRFRCSFYCGKSFNFSHHLKHHELTHTNTKQHFCKTCGKGFIQAHHLKTHEKSHEPKNRLPCTFPDCKKKFVDEYARKRHIATHRKTYDAGSSPDSNAASKISLSEKCQDGKLHPSRRKLIVECKSTQKLETLKIKVFTPRFIDFDKRDSQNNKQAEKDLLSGRYDNCEDSENNYVDDGINTCKTAIGSCLVTGDSKIDENCLCAQISNTTGETKEFILSPNNETIPVNEIDTVKAHKDKGSKVSSVVTLQKDYESVSRNCKGCKCANICSISEKIACKKEEPNIEYIPGGIVKLRDTFDFDFLKSAKEQDKIKDVSDELNNKVRDCKSSTNFKSCKDVIGNCIVSGNSTMGEGCLCARMMVDDQAMAEEIDEITPCPQGVT